MHNVPVPAPSKTFPLETTGRIIRIQVLTLIWMGVEAAVSLGAAWAARSPALLGFGGDSAVELLSAAIVLRRFYRPADEAHAEERAARLAGELALRFRSVCCPCFYPYASWDTSKHCPSPYRNRLAHSCRSGHALARQTKTAALRHYGQCSAKGRRRRVCGLRLSGFDLLGRSRRQCDMGSEMG